MARVRLHKGETERDERAGVGFDLARLWSARVFFGVRSLRKERKKGTLFASGGDCSTCKTQCRTNPNYYYGIQQKGEPK